MSITPPSPDAELSDVDALDRDLGWAIGVVSRSYRRLAMAAVEQLPAGPRGYHLLCAVADGPPRSQLALARRLGIDRTVMTYLVDDLEKAGMVVRRPDPLDRRARQVTITASGSRALERAREQVLDAESELLANLTAAEADVLRSVLTRLARDAQEVAVRSGGSAAPSC